MKGRRSSNGHCLIMGDSASQIASAVANSAARQAAAAPLRTSIRVCWWEGESVWPFHNLELVSFSTARDTYLLVAGTPEIESFGRLRSLLGLPPEQTSASAATSSGGCMQRTQAVSNWQQISPLVMLSSAFVSFTTKSTMGTAAQNEVVVKNRILLTG